MLLIWNRYCERKFKYSKFEYSKVILVAPHHTNIKPWIRRMVQEEQQRIIMTCRWMWRIKKERIKESKKQTEGGSSDDQRPNVVASHTTKKCMFKHLSSSSLPLFIINQQVHNVYKILHSHCLCSSITPHQHSTHGITYITHIRTSKLLTYILQPPHTFTFTYFIYLTHKQSASSITVVPRTQRLPLHSINYSLIK